MITYYSANKLLDYNFGGSTYTVPTNYYFGLSRSTIQIDGTGVNEPTTGAYARVGLANTKSSFTVAGTASLSNSVAVTFVESTASWGTITDVGVWDALTAGNLWWYDVLSPARTIAASTTVLFAIGGITISMTNA